MKFRVRLKGSSALSILSSHVKKAAVYCPTEVEYGLDRAWIDGLGLLGRSDIESYMV